MHTDPLVLAAPGGQPAAQLDLGSLDAAVQTLSSAGLVTSKQAVYRHHFLQL